MEDLRRLNEGWVRFQGRTNHEYFLGYFPDGLGFLSRKPVYGVYFGCDDRQHVFLNKTREGEVEIYTRSLDSCILIFYSEGDGVEEIAVGVSHAGTMAPGRERDFAVERIDAVRNAAKKSLEAQLAQLAAK